MSEQLTNSVSLHCSDCLAVLPTLAENSIDSCCTDPPYHLTSVVKRYGSENAAPAQFGTDGAFARASRGFMGKQWDGGDIAFRPELWREVFRVLKPGAHLLAFGGTRTYHRMACAIEDAGFEVRDTVLYLYGSGFPKSLNVSRNIDRCACSDGGRENDTPLSERDLRSLQNTDVSPHVHNGEEYSEVLLAELSEQDSPSTVLWRKPTQGAQRNEERCVEGRRNLSETPRKLREREIYSLPAGIDSNGTSGRLRDGASPSDSKVDRASASATGMCSSQGSSAVEQCQDEFGTLAMQSQPQECGARDHCGRCGKPIISDGLGTALKPACELVILARKPLSERTVAVNVLKWGTGALNIGASRVGTGEDKGEWPITKRRHDDVTYTLQPTLTDTSKGRWPANLIHDGSEEVVGAFPECAPATSRTPSEAMGVKSFSAGNNPTIYPDSGSAARFFYTAKADADDRLGSKHPTVKPLDLMQYLVRLVTLRGGLVLDPFAGTGTTGEAAMREGMRAVLIEREVEYQADIRRRMQLAMAGPDERQHESIKARGLVEDPGPLFAMR